MNINPKLKKQATAAHQGPGLRGPFRQPVFRNVWSTGVVSNLGTHVQAVGAAWAMTQLTTNPQTIASVQSMAMLPMMLFALVAGAIADLFDRRAVALTGLAVSLSAAGLLAFLSEAALITPASLLSLCFVVALGTTLFSPSWQASVRDQVKPEDLPSAIALNSISFNVGRSLGPAIGGIIVAFAGASAAFAANALSFIPIMIALFLWKSPKIAPRAPRESLRRAVTLGLTYTLNAPAIRVVLLRVLLATFAGGAILALLPVIVRRLLDGDALLFGFLLGAFGFGAVTGAALIPRLRHRASNEAIVGGAALVLGTSLLVIAFSRIPALTALALVPAGACWTISSSTFNVTIQLAAPRWVAGRAVSTYQTALSAGTAIGSWVWGGVAEEASVSIALVGAGAFAIVTCLVGLRWPMPPVPDGEAMPEALPEPDVRMVLQPRSGPITVLMHYRIAAKDAAAFRQLMLEVRLVRRRNGATSWSLGRDVGEPERWIERFRFATWSEYLRFRNRTTVTERILFAGLRELQIGGEAPTVQRLFERPTENVAPAAEGLPDANPGTYYPP